MKLFYRFIHGHAREDRAAAVQVVATYPNFGGQRFWWLCPGCNRRVLKLYQAGGMFACRHCHNLGYESTRRDDCDDCATKLWAIRRKLKATGNITDPLPWLKPSYMRWRTYYELLSEHERLLFAYIDAMNNLFF